MSGILKRCHVSNFTSEAKDGESCLVRNGRGQMHGLKRRRSHMRIALKCHKVCEWKRLRLCSVWSHWTSFSLIPPIRVAQTQNSLRCKAMSFWGLGVSKSKHSSLNSNSLRFHSSPRSILLSIMSVVMSLLGLLFTKCSAEG